MTEKNNFLIYGANGYTGQLIIREAIAKGQKPIIAGRNENEIKALAEQYDLPCSILDLTEIDKLDEALRTVKAVIHCAGPFHRTYEVMANACIKNKTHYLDITGEISVFEGLHKMDQSAKEADIMLLPGSGFDVVPTDCLAAYLKSKLPTATHLELGFSGGSKPSKGTSLTMMESFSEGGKVRIDGELTKVPFGYKNKAFYINGKTLTAATIPWGDVSTAYYSTGIGNIEVYTQMPAKQAKMMKYVDSFGWILGNKSIQNWQRKKILSRPAGPSDEQRARAVSLVWGSVSDADGNEYKAMLNAPDGYTLTAKSAVLIAEKVINDNWKAGFQTPSLAYGADLILEIEGTKRSDLT